MSVEYLEIPTYSAVVHVWNMHLHMYSCICAPVRYLGGQEGRRTVI